MTDQQTYEAFGLNTTWQDFIDCDVVHIDELIKVSTNNINERATLSAIWQRSQAQDGSTGGNLLLEALTELRNSMATLSVETRILSGEIRSLMERKRSSKHLNKTRRTNR